MQAIEQAAGDRRGDARDQRSGVAEVGGKAVARFVGEPVAVAAADDVHADHAVMRFQFLGERVEIAAVARQAVHAEHDVRVARVAPVGVRDAVKAVRAEAEKALLRHCHGWPPTERMHAGEPPTVLGSSVPEV